MTKQLNLDLAAALEDAQQGRDDGEMLIVRAGSAYMKVKAFNAGKHAAALRKIRAPRQRGELRTYPRFKLGMSTAEYVAKFAALNTTDEAIKNNRMPAYVLPFGNLNAAPCALYENGAFDFDVIEEIDADDAQSVAAPEVQSAPAAAVDSLYNPGTPDPKNSAALPELDGFKPGDVVDVDGRTIGRSTIELVFLRKLAGFDAEPLARIVGASGKRLDVQLFQLTRVEAPEPEAAQDTAPAQAQDFAADIPARLVMDAFSGTSFTPEQRGERQRQAYAASMAEALATLTEQATKGGTLDKLPEVFAKYRARQARAMSAYLASSSRCVSTMIAGPANFPAARMNKRAEIAHQRLADYLDGGRAALRRAIHALRPDLRPIMAGDADAIERLQAKIDAAERNQAMMKAANAAIRKHAKAGEAHQVAALMELGFKESSAIELLRPMHHYRQGFESFTLTNNNANIRRMRERLEQITRAQAKPVTQVQSASGITLEDDAPANRVRIFFPGKPAEEVRSELKKNGFRWAPSIGAWQAYRNRWTLETARELAGDPAQETPAAEIVEQSPPVAALKEVSHPCGDIAPAAQDVAESEAAAPVEIEAADGAAAPAEPAPMTAEEPAKASASPEFAMLMAQARQARQMARDAVAKAQASARGTRPTEPRTTQAPAAAIRFMQHYVTNGTSNAKCRYYASTTLAGRAFVDVDAVSYGAQLRPIFGSAVRNDTDTMTDYFCKDSVRIFSESPLYPAALARAKANDAKRQERQAKRKELKEQIQPSQQVAPAAIGPSLFSDPRSGAPVVVPNKATADAMARSRQLNGKVAVRKATPEEMADKRNAFTGYNAGEGRRMGYVLEMLQPQRKERSGY